MQKTTTWIGNWKAVAPPTALTVKLPRSRHHLADLRRTLRSLPQGAPVILRADAMGARFRCRRLLASAEIDLEREFIALPSAQAPGYLVEDSTRAVAFFCGSLAAMPGGLGVNRMFVQAIASVLAWKFGAGILGRIAPGRVVVGRRR